MESKTFGNLYSGIQNGVNNGIINYYASTHPETPPSPIFAVPYQRDLDFVDRLDERGSILNQVAGICSKPGSGVALVGLGGVGKSGLVIEYCYRVYEKSPDIWVFWVHASNKSRFELSYKNIAEQAKIPGRQDPNSNVYQSIQNWFQDGKRGKWILVLDNLDDDEFFCTPIAPGKPLLKTFLPQSPSGSIIITTRSWSIARKFFSERSIISIGIMDEYSALDLLQKKLATREAGDGNDDARQLVGTLGYFPLAIVQAGAFIVQRLPRYSIKQYLKDFLKSKQKRAKLLGHEVENLQRDNETSNSIMVTWQISFEYINKKRSSAADLLALMSFFDRQGIQDELLQTPPRNNASLSRDSRKQDDNDSDDESEWNEVFEDDLVMLKDYSLISICPDKRTFEMHRLVQLAIHQWLKSHAKFDVSHAQFINRLYREFPFPLQIFNRWLEYQSWFPHVKLAMEYRPESNKSRREWVTLLYKGANFANEAGNLDDTEQITMKAIAEHEELLGWDHPETIECHFTIFSLHSRRAQWPELQSAASHLLTRSRLVLGPEHPCTVITMGYLALAYNRQDQLEDAERVETQVLHASRKIFGEEDQRTLSSMNSLGFVYRRLGRYEDAESLSIKVLEVRRKILGEKHLDTLNSMDTLASLYDLLGRYEDAEPLGAKSVEIHKSVFGEQHLDTIASMNILASIYNHLGRYQDAERLGTKVLDIRKSVLGEEHPDTLESMEILRDAYNWLSRPEEAESLGQQVLEISKRVYGTDHSYTLTQMRRLHAIYQSQGRFQDAEPLQAQIVDISMRTLGEEHLDTLLDMAVLADVYDGIGRHEDAEALETHIMEVRMRLFGEEHPNTLRTMANLALTYQSQGRLQEAESLQKEVVAIQRRIHGDDDSTSLLFMFNLQSIYQSQGRFQEAEELQLQVLQGRRIVLGEEDPQTLDSLYSLAWICKSLGTQVLGEKHSGTLQCIKFLESWRVESTPKENDKENDISSPGLEKQAEVPQNGIESSKFGRLRTKVLWKSSQWKKRKSK
ncbi:hypothetical protein N7462_002802 [Penicillium macrosclerotiorum]|uniref:uncharacterized protein n=1 Tax=Penicillium macrosclerotiorum TaxID=303699 RepID=UPI002546B674|nr:uncharacterized protein N7462_002802 [Penicillium macrosclerotiorum]KAJ5693379.1 hypothetical protein N7462_002802 [Penicillium macrosclerotiorum]